MDKYYLSLQKEGKNIGYVVVNIYKPFDKEFTKEDIPDVIDDYIDYSIGIWKKSKEV